MTISYCQEKHTDFNSQICPQSKAYSFHHPLRLPQTFNTVVAYLRIISRSSSSKHPLLLQGEKGQKFCSCTFSSFKPSQIRGKRCTVIKRQKKNLYSYFEYWLMNYSSINNWKKRTRVTIKIKSQRKDRKVVFRNTPLLQILKTSSITTNFYVLYWILDFFLPSC